MFSYIGFQPEEITVESQTVIELALVEDILSFSELVVIGYGTQKKGVISHLIKSK